MLLMIRQKQKNIKTVPSNILTLFDMDLDSLFLKKKKRQKRKKRKKNITINNIHSYGHDEMVDI